MKNKSCGVLWLLFSLSLTALAPSSSHAQSADTAPVRVPEVHVESSFSPKGSWISSFITTDKGTRLTHGIQVQIGPDNQVQSLDVYNKGVVEQATRLHSNGVTFRSLRVDYSPNGLGYETIYATDHTELLSGVIKAGLRWDGSFLIKEYTVKGDSPIAPENLAIMVYIFDKGRPVDKKPFDTKTLLLSKDSWLTKRLEEALHDSEIVIVQ